MKSKDRINGIPWFLLFVALYPITALYSSNISEVNVFILIRPYMFYILMVSILYVVVWIIIKQSTKAAFFVAISTIIFSSYGIIYKFIEGLSIGGLIIGRHRFLGAVTLILYCLIILLILRTKNGKIQKLVGPTNFIGLVLMIMPIAIVVTHSNQIKFPSNKRSTFIAENSISTAVPYPDIYYFLLDSYAREDYLKQYIGYDNSPFLSQLREMGFFVADCSLSNYTATRMSLSSSLNMTYIPDLSPGFQPQGKNETVLDPYIKNNKLVEYLKNKNYKTVTFETGYPFSDLVDFDYHISGMDNPILVKYLTEFEVLSINNSIVSAFKGVSLVDRFLGMDFEYHDKYQRQRFILSRIPQIPSIQSPKFVFIHLVTTHRPYIFNPDGSPILDRKYYYYNGYPADQATYVDGYKRVIEYTNRQLIPILKEILRESKRKPVIILQGDHGPQQPGRSTILLAIYGINDSIAISPEISPVNIFPTVLNDVFNANIPLKENKYYSSSLSEDTIALEPKSILTPCEVH